MQIGAYVVYLDFQSEDLVLSKETKEKRLEDGYFRIGKTNNRQYRNGDYWRFIL